MKDLRSKKAIAASLSLTLALGSVPAVALADNADENGEGTTSEQSSQAEFVFSANGGQFADGSIRHPSWETKVEALTLLRLPAQAIPSRVGTL